MSTCNQKNAPARRTRAMVLGTVAVLTVIISIGCSASGGDDGNLTKLEYVGPVCEPSISAGFLDVSYDGLVFVLGGYGAADDFLHVYTVDGTDKGTFKNAAGNAISATMFFIDKSNLVNVIEAGFWTSNTLSRYRTDGTLYDEVSLESGPVVPLTDGGITLLDNGSIAIGGMRTNNIETMSLDVINMNLETTHSLTGPELVAMIPGFAEAGKATAKGYLSGIGSGVNNEVYVTVEFDDGDTDGVLVLNSDLTKKNYVGGDWDFNCPFDVATDGNGYHYVSNMSHNNVKVFNTSWSKVAITDPDDSDSSILQYPSMTCVRGDYVYVFCGGTPNKVHRFKTFKDCPEETIAADPPKFTGGSVPANTAPVIDSVSLVASYHYDISTNYMGGTFTYTASAHDPDGDAINYEWELNESGAGGHASLISSGNTAIVTADSFGSGSVTLTVTDEHNKGTTYPCDNYAPK